MSFCHWCHRTWIYIHLWEIKNNWKTSRITMKECLPTTQSSFLAKCLNIYIAEETLHILLMLPETVFYGHLFRNLTGNCILSSYTLTRNPLHGSLEYSLYRDSFVSEKIYLFHFQGRVLRFIKCPKIAMIWMDSIVHTIQV